MRFRVIEAEKAHHPVSRIASTLGVTRAGYHAWKRRGPSLRACEDARLKELLEKAFAASHETYGAPRLQVDLAEQGVHVGRKRVARLMRELGIVGVSRRGRRPVLRSAAETAAAPDLVRRRFTATARDELWVADITYIATWEGWLFLAAIMDIYTKRIVGWSMHDDLKADLVVDALGMAVTMRRPETGLIHHSDRGGQYRSLALGRTLRDSGIMASMGSRGDAYDNAAAESFMATIKTELVHRQRFKTRDAARLAVFRYIEGFYNPHRRHSALGYLSPVEYEKMLDDREARVASAV